MLGSTSFTSQTLSVMAEQAPACPSSAAGGVAQVIAGSIQAEVLAWTLDDIERGDEQHNAVSYEYG